MKPQRLNFDGPATFDPRAMRNTAATINTAPANADTATLDIPRKATAHPQRNAISAPSDPPLAMPSV